METLVSKFEKKFAEQIEDLEGQVDFIRKYLPEIDNAEAILCTNGEARIGLPLDPPSNKKVIKQLEDAGFTVGNQSLSDFGFGVFHTLKFEGRPICQFDLAFFDFHEGATCKLQSIGTKKVDKHIYEVVCNEGAEEMSP